MATAVILYNEIYQCLYNYNFYFTVNLSVCNTNVHYVVCYYTRSVLSYFHIVNGIVFTYWKSHQLVLITNYNTENIHNISYGIYT